MELGVCTFGDVAGDPRTGATISPQQRLADLREEVELADQVGLDVFGVGEHHRPDHTVSAPAVVLAEVFGHQRFLMQTSMGAVPHRDAMRSIELLGTEVAPVVRAEVAERTAASA